MLLWAFAAGIPILLHLLTRRQRRTVRWAAVQFVIAAYQRSQRKFRLLQWLLLALRVLAIAMLAIALADPIINATAAVSQRQRPHLQILVIDGSMSMKTRRDAGSRWSDAIDAATRRCKAAAPGDGFLLLQATSPIQWIVDSITLDAAQMQQTLATLRPVDSTASMELAIAEVLQKLSTLRRDGSWQDDATVTIFSDLQVDSWRGVAQQIKPTAETQWEVVDVGSRDVDNSHIESFNVDSSFFVADQPLQFQGRIARSKQASADPMLVQLMVDDVVRESRRVEIAAGDRGATQWQIALPAGEHVVALQIPDDDLNADNVRRMVIDVRPELSVLCVGPDEDSTRFVATALRSGTTGRLRVEQRATSRLTDLKSKTLDFLVLCDFVSLRNEDLPWLRRYLQQGGSVMLWLGPRCDPQAFNRSFATGDADDPLSIARIRSQAPADQYTIDPLGYRHGITQPFQSHPDSGLITTPIFQYWKIEPLANANVQQVLGIGQSDPLFLTKPLAAGGQLMLVATAASPGADSGGQAWNAIALWPSFIPLMQESVALTRMPTGIPRNFELQGPHDAGVYPVQRDGKVVGQFAVNPPQAESDLTSLSIDQLPASLRNEDDDDAVPSRQADPTDRDGLPLFQIVLACLIGCLVAESVVSRQLNPR